MLMGRLAPQEGPLQTLPTIPGLHATGTAMLYIEMGGGVQAFGSPEKLSSWALLCPRNHESAGKRKSGQACKGNP